MALPGNYIFIEYDDIDSTNLEAVRLVQSGKVYGDTVIVAKRQEAGKGRAGRSWVSEEGNLFVSIVKGDGRSLLGNDADLFEQFPLHILPFATALAVGDSLQELISNQNSFGDNGGIEYKWPNDVLVGGNKISGVLIEIVNGYAVIGVGVNVISSPKTNTKLPATSLKECNVACTAREVLELLVKNLDKRFGQLPDDILRDWLARAYKINEKVTVAQENNAISGIYKGIDSNGQLILETDKGTREPVLYGDVVFEMA